MNRVIILENNGGRLANQLWQYANIYAYCLEGGYIIDNYAFWQYQENFNFPNPKNNIIDYLFFRFYRFHRNKRFAKIIYLIFCFFVKILFKKRIKESEEIVFLPPSWNDLTGQYIEEIEKSQNKNFYFCGWNFRNPVGLKKYHSELVEFLKPNKKISEKVEVFIGELRKKYKYLIGVHVRQGDYKNFAGGQYFFSFPEVRAILNDFLASQTDKKEEVIFIICSDGLIDQEALNGLNYVAGPGDFMSDLYSLARTDLLISSISTFGQWASYYGQVNNVNFSKDKINWDSEILSDDYPRNLTEWERF